MKEKVKGTINGILMIVLFGLIVMIGYKLLFPIDQSELEQTAKIQSSNKIKIGFSLGTLKEERWFKDRDILMAKVQELGAEIYVHNANNDDLDQLNQVKSLIKEGIDVLILVPNDMEKASEAVRLAKKEGIKVISYDRLVIDSNIDMYISFDNEKVGELMAQALIEENPEGNYLIINGAPTDHNTSMIKNGYNKVLKEYIKSGKVDVVEEAWAANWMREEAFEVTDKYLSQGIRFDAILCGNDSLADGAVEALSQHRVAGETNVVGQDADLTACQRIVDDLQLMTVYKPIDKLASVTAEIAVRMARGEDVGTKRKMNIGIFEIPYYVLDPVAITKDNIDETIIRDGFHMRDEIYDAK